MKNKLKTITIIFMSFLIIFINSTTVKADHFGTNENTYKQEKQLIEKIEIIKKIFPNQIDEAAILATLSHRGVLTSYINESYTASFNKENYETSVQTLVNDLKDEAFSTSAKNGDLLLAITIIMLDSSSWTGTYSDENYKKALAGDKLIGNMADEDNPIEDFLANGVNTLFCMTGAAADTAYTVVEFGMALGEGKLTQTAINKSSRYITMSSICEKGYLGGTYTTISTLEDEKRKQAIKEKYAEEIIQLAESFRNEESCVYSSEGTGEPTNWRQYAESWGSKVLGNSGQTIKQIGCTATSMSYLINKSGTALNLNSFDPGVFVENTKYSSSGALNWGSWSEFAPNFKMDKQNQNLIGQTASSVAPLMENLLNTPSGNNNQTFVIIEMTNHWVALDHVENGVVYVMDPAAEQGVGLVTLETALNRDGKTRNLISYNTFYATDVSIGQTGPSSLSGKNGGTNYCNTEGSLDGFLRFIGEIEGVQETCVTSSGKEGYKSYLDPADTTYVGKTTSYGLTQKNNKDLATTVGYTNYDKDMSNGCVEKQYIDAMAKQTLQDRTDVVTKSYEEKSNGKKLAEYQYHALASINHQYPQGSIEVIKRLVNISDLKSYQVYALFMEYNGLYGAQGGLNRREAEYHLFYNGNYYLDRVFDVQPTEAYWKKRVEVYKNEQVQ